MSRYPAAPAALNTPPLAMVNPPAMVQMPPVQFSAPAMVTGGVAFTEPLAMLMVSLFAGTPNGDQFPGSCQFSFTRPVHVLVAAPAPAHVRRNRRARMA